RSYYFDNFNRVLELGWVGDNNCVAIAMVTSVGLALFLGLSARSWWLKVLTLLVGVAMAHVVLLAFSRGGMLALMVMGAVAFLLVPKRPLHFLALVLVVLVVLRLAGTEVRDRFT